MRFTTVALLAALAGSALAQQHTNHAALRQIAELAKIRAEARKQEARFMARLLGIPELISTPGGGIAELMAFERGRPQYLATDNANAAISTGANRLHPGGASGLNLTGSGVILGIWDGGTTRTTHQELAGRVTVIDGEPRSGDHATHVSGTMIASGVVTSAKGMSFQATLHSYGWNNDDAEMATAGSNGLRLSNHSYGYITGWYSNGVNWYWYGDVTLSTVEDNGFGLYDSTAQAWDNVAYNAPYYLIVKSAGNDRNGGPASQPVSHYYWEPSTSAWTLSSAVRNLDGNGTGYDTISYNGTAKNILLVGAVNDVLSYTGPSSVTMSSFSSWGPTDDGRLKPDLVANGVSLYSSTGGTDTSYASFSGTSMSSPNTTGSLGLLVQHQRNLFGTDLLAATMKALVVNSARECGTNAGPDYAFGWGLLNVDAAAATLSEDTIRPSTVTENLLSAGGTFTQTVYSDGSAPLRATMAWTDPAGTPPGWLLNPTTSVLVNDLDLRIGDGTTTWAPWVLNPASPAAAATTGDNFRDNVEQVLVATPAAGYYTLTVTHKGGGLMPSGSQAFSLVVSGASNPPATAELSSMTLAASSVAGGASTTGTVELTNTQGGTVALSSNSSAASVPSQVSVPSGSTSAGFSVDTSAVAATTSATISASRNAETRTANLEVRAAQLTSVSVSPTEVTGGDSSAGTVAVSGTVPAGGISVALGDNAASVSVPASVSVAGGQTSAGFTALTTAVAATEVATITATFESTSVTCLLTVQPAAPTVALSALAISPTSVFEGTGTTGTVTLDAAAPTGGANVAISEAGGTSSLTLPASVAVAEGATSANFAIGTGASGNTSITRTVEASYGGATRTASVTINPLTPASLGLSPGAVKAGSSSTGTVTLNAPAGAGGTVVSLSSSNSAIAQVPATVTVLQGQTSRTFTVTTSTGYRRTSVIISATRNGVTRTAKLNIK